MQINFIALFLLTLTFTFTGCASGQKQAVEILPESRPPEREFKAYHGQSNLAAGAGASTAMEETTGPLTLRRAISLTLMKNPELAAFSWEVRAKDAARLQASLLPNPELAIEMENLAGSGQLSGTTAVETTIQLSQLIELGSKREKRERVASLNKDLARWDYESKRLAIFNGVTVAFIDVLSTQSHLALAAEMANLAEQVYLTVSERVKAGKVPPIEETKAKVSLSSSRIELERMKRELKTARKKVAAYWGNSIPRFKSVDGDLDDLSPVPSYSSLVSYISNNPDIARWSAEMESRRAALDLSKAGKMPDLTISGGYRQFNETNDNAFVVGVSIPLMFFDRSQGDIAEASHRLTKGLQEQKTVEIEVKTALSEAYQRLSIAHAEANALKTEVLSGAKLAFDAASEGYRLGKFNFLEVLDAQRTLFEVKEQYLKSLTDYHGSVAEVERLIGVGLDKVAYTTKSDIKGDK